MGSLVISPTDPAYPAALRELARARRQAFALRARRAADARAASPSSARARPSDGGRRVHARARARARARGARDLVRRRASGSTPPRTRRRSTPAGPPWSSRAAGSIGRTRRSTVALFERVARARAARWSRACPTATPPMPRRVPPAQRGARRAHAPRRWWSRPARERRALHGGGGAPARPAALRGARTPPWDAARRGLRPRARPGRARRHLGRRRPRRARPAACAPPRAAPPGRRAARERRASSGPAASACVEARPPAGGALAPMACERRPMSRGDLATRPAHIDEVCERVRAAAPGGPGALLTLTLRAVVVEGPAGFFRRARRRIPAARAAVPHVPAPGSSRRPASAPFSPCLRIRILRLPEIDPLPLCALRRW